MQAEARFALALVLFKREVYALAEEQLNAGKTLLPVETAPGIYSKYLDLKGQILSVKGDPAAVKYFLESYEVDLDQGDFKGVTISLIHLADWYLKEGRLDRALARLEEAEGYALNGGFIEDAGSIANLKGRVYRAKGDQQRARSHFLSAARFDAAAGHPGLAEEDEKLAAACG